MDVPLLWRKDSRFVTMNSVVDSAGLGGDVCPPSKVELSLMSSDLIGDFNLSLPNFSSIWINSSNN